MIKLKDTKNTDLDKIQKIEFDPENKDFIIPNSIIQHKKLLENKDIKYWSIFNGLNEFVGYCILGGITNPNNSIELRRIVIEPKGKGYGRKAIQKIKEYCFVEKKCHRLWLDVFEFNTKARELYKKEGFIEKGLLRDAVKSKTGYINLVLMSQLIYDFKS